MNCFDCGRESANLGTARRFNVDLRDFQIVPVCIERKDCQFSKLKPELIARTQAIDTRKAELSQELQSLAVEREHIQRELKYIRKAGV